MGFAASRFAKLKAGIHMRWAPPEGIPATIREQSVENVYMPLKIMSPRVIRRDGALVGTSVLHVQSRRRPLEVRYCSGRVFSPLPMMIHRRHS